MVHMLVVPPVLRRPHERRIFKRRSAEDQGEQPHGPVSLERQMGKKPVITQRDAQAGKKKHDKKQGRLEPIHAETPKVKRHGGQGEHKGSNEKHTGFPVDPVDGNAKNHANVKLGR